MTYCDLKVVNLVINFNDTKQIYAVLCLCRSAPNLEELIIKACNKVETLLLLTVPFWEGQVCKEGDIFHHLKTVSLSDFKGGYNQLGIAEFILLNSVVLETLNIEWKRSIKADKKLLRVLEQMMQFKRSSTEAKVVFSGLS
ncbi:hypothetical protein FRX31_004600 [Thalictrum thalictroides]|uniref:FBD domain-containing protein n=1 Tax=Thalictrum thalictroides TaxID=46969 RepID=A0A7J6X8R3_THATH|nr:hypothetical protein FRX31_004600 [Thalictrum thalictroides]